jgi:hypothetical protein
MRYFQSFVNDDYWVWDGIKGYWCFRTTGAYREASKYTLDTVLRSNSGFTEITDPFTDPDLVVAKGL